MGDKCLAVWSKNNQLYEAKITEAPHEPEKVYRVKYENYDEVEERSLIELCPVIDQHLSSDDRYHQHRKSQHKREEHWRVVICIVYCTFVFMLLASPLNQQILLFTDYDTSRIK